MIGDTYIVGGVEMEVIWDGGSLLPERATVQTDLWEPVRACRPYNKTGKHRKATQIKVDNPGVAADNPEAVWVDDEFERFKLEAGNGS